MMTNLLEETRKEIVDSGHEESGVVFIGSRVSGHRCTWDEFCVLADVEYHNGYGGAEVASDLVVVFSDGAWLERHEYDGREWWECRHPFTQPEVSFPITRLVKKVYGGTLREMNQSIRG